jgi:hypothetical protein
MGTLDGVLSKLVFRKLSLTTLLRWRAMGSFILLVDVVRMEFFARSSSLRSRLIIYLRSSDSSFKSSLWIARRPPWQCVS